MKHIALCLIVISAGCERVVPTAGTQPKRTEATSAAAVDRTPVESVRALHLWNAFHENELAADKKYGNKYVTIEGRAGKTGKDDAGKYFIQFGQNFASGAIPPAVVCVIAPSSEPDFASIAEGDTITVIGKIVGKKITPLAYEGFIVVLHDTTLVKLVRRDSGKAGQAGTKGK